MSARIVILSLVISVALAGCLETTGGNSIAQEPVSSKKTAVAAKEKPAPKRAAAARTGLARQVRADLHDGCLTAHGGLFGGEKIEAQCTCYADSMLKTMGKEDLEFYTRYDVIPTLNAARPYDVKRTCGIEGIRPPGSDGPLPQES